MRTEKKSIPNTIFHYFVLIILILIVPITSFVIYHIYSDLTKNSENFRNNYIENQKILIKSQVNNVVNYIHYQRLQMIANRKQQLRDRVYEASAIADKIYIKNQDLRNPEDLQKDIMEALRPIRFDNGKNGYFIIDLAGILKLDSSNPGIEGSNLLLTGKELQRKNYQDAIQLIKNQQEGFCTSVLPETQETQKTKTSYLKLFAPFNWIIGTNEYVEDIEPLLQQETLAWIKSIHYGDNNYIFAARWDGLSLAGPSEGTNILVPDNPIGIEIMKKLIDLAKNGGGFISYDLSTVDKNKVHPSQKISYIQGIPEWEWYIGTGVYVYNMEKEITQIRERMLYDLRLNIIQIFLITLFGIVISYGFTKWMENKIDHEIKKFTTFFRLSSQQSMVMDSHTLIYEEFRDLSQSLNDMLTERKKIENRLKDSEEQVRLLLDSTAEAIYGVDLEGWCIFANPACLRLLGFSSLDEIIGFNTHQLFHYAYPDGKPYPTDDCTIKKSITLQQGFHNAIEYLWHKDHTCFPAEVWSYPIFRENRLVGVVVTFVDIREKVEADKKKKDLENQLIQVHKMEAVGQLAGGIAHDFNNILTGIIGNLILAEPHIDPLHSRFVRNAVAASQRAAGLVQKLLEFSRKTSISMEIIDIEPFIKEFYAMLRETIDRRIEIRTQVDPEIPCIKGDAAQLLTVLLNLCINASDAIKDILTQKIYPERGKRSIPYQDHSPE